MCIMFLWIVTFSVLVGMGIAVSTGMCDIMINIIIDLVAVIPSALSQYT